MATKNKITQNTADKLRCAIAIACEVRLKVYTLEESQCDNAIDFKKKGDNIQKFLNIVGKASTINYFQITYCLQCEVAKQLNFTKFCFYSNAELINITIGLAFGMEDMIIFSNNPPKNYWDLRNFNFDLCIEQLEKHIKLNPRTGLLPKLRRRVSDNVLKVFKKDVAFSYNLNTAQIKAIANNLLLEEI